MRYLLGYDIGSSSIKVALLDANTGRPVASAFSPVTEMAIHAVEPGFAEQDPEDWWKELIAATVKLKSKCSFASDEIIAIGISYQMHGLVCVDKDLKPLRPSIIWCDSRAVDIGNRAFGDLGGDFCLKNFLNSPGNFTASKLKWVKDKEPQIYQRIHKVMLPGDYIALKLTGEAVTTVSGLSEGIFWNYPSKRIASELLDYFQIDKSLLSTVVPNFGDQGQVSKEAAAILGLSSGIPVSYRAGDQPNNAWSLNVLEPGEIAATAGTSGVIYGVTDKITYDPQSRVNTFVHVNNSNEQPRYGVLLCVNGTGILNSWVQKNLFAGQSYESINEAAAKVPIGSDGLKFYPFGNGAERMLVNKDPGAKLEGLQFNRHQREHVARAAQEGIAFSLNYGAGIMRGMGMSLSTIRAGHANMFLSDIFATTFANTSGCSIELYNTDGAIGAARAAGVGAGHYRNYKESFTGMELIKKIEPNVTHRQQTDDSYGSWKNNLSTLIQ